MSNNTYRTVRQIIELVEKIENTWILNMTKEKSA